MVLLLAVGRAVLVSHVAEHPGGHRVLTDRERRRCELLTLT